MVLTLEAARSRTIEDPWSRGLVVSYLRAKREVILAGVESEITWQEDSLGSEITEPTFLRESAWVVLSSGMRESVIKKLFPDLTVVFGGWASADWITCNKDDCRRQALTWFRHEDKIEAIISIAKEIASGGLDELLKKLMDIGPSALCHLPYIGPITSFHLAKNLGIPVAKADRHLQRVADHVGANSVTEMCRVISSLLDEPVPVVDLVIWRYATLERNYLSQFTSSFQVPQHSI